MATRVLLHLGQISNKCLLSNAQCPRTKFLMQDVLKQSRSFRRIRNSEEIIKSPFSEELAWSGPSAGRKLWRGFVFASAFTGVSLVGATILEYERIRDRTYKSLSPFSKRFRTSYVGWRRDIKDWWLNLSEGQRMFWFICYANTLVFLAWKVPQLQSVMMKYFTTNPTSKNVCVPMMLSMFSHYNLWHLAANMYVLHSFSTAAVGYLGREHFFAIYFSSGVVSSFFSNAYKILINKHGYSLGASGAIMGILAFICTQFPETKLSIIMLPQFTFSAGAAIKSIIAFDTTGCILGWKFFDHAAHLGGALFGMFWQSWGIENIWRKRSPILTYWHEFRSPPK